MTRFFEYAHGKFINLSMVREVTIHDPDEDTSVVDIEYEGDNLHRCELPRYELARLKGELGRSDNIVAAPPGFQLGLYDFSKNIVAWRAPIVAFRINADGVEAVCSDGESSVKSVFTDRLYLIINPDGKCRELNDLPAAGWFSNEDEYLKSMAG
jgi:hypothetical protein